MTIDIEHVDLTNCDREPIHTPGSIQPHGAMLVVDPGTHLILHASSNAAEFIGFNPKIVVGSPLSSVLGDEYTHQISNAAARAGSTQADGVLLNIRVGDNGGVVDITIHTVGDRLILEFERPASRADAEVAMTLTQALVRRLAKETEVSDLVSSVAKLVRATLGYDRVMVYHFLSNGDGRVIAEAKAFRLHSLLGQYFPHSDIPVQARQLYLKNWVRIIGNSDYIPVGLTPSLLPGQPALDMSFAHLRSVSPIHCQYLRNMDVASSMSVSVVVNGELWGLIACHHQSPKVLSVPLRVATELFAQYFSLQVAAAEARSVKRAAGYARRRLDAIIKEVDPDVAVETLLQQRIKDFSSLMPSDGVGVWIDGIWTSLGPALETDDIPALITVARKTSNAHDVWETHDLRAHLDQRDAVGRMVAGVLLIPISVNPAIYLIYFRSERVHEIHWAGNPQKPETAASDRQDLSPRASFQVWKETVRGRSLPWSDDNVTAAEAVRGYFRDLILQHRDASEEQRARTEAQRELLNAELNHRVKNVLALVKSIASQTGIHSKSIQEFAASFEGRLRALSFAHDQSYAGHDGGELRSLIDAEASMHRFQQLPERFTINGPPVGLSERAFGVFALLLHEMMTNAAKYGCLSQSGGALSVEWKLSPGGDCLLDWTETGGPVVVKPTRQGFGTSLIHRTVSADLGGDVKLEFLPTGLHAQFVIPAAHLHAVAPPPVGQENRSVPAVLTGLTILLVEDQSLIAMDVEEMLRELSCAEVMTAASVSHAIRLIDEVVPDLAILDINLGGETSGVIADELSKRSIPFVFATGYSDSSGVPLRFATIPVIKKPMSMEALSATLGKLQLDVKDQAPPKGAPGSGPIHHLGLEASVSAS
jgi:light-regulated signal transduction histidine kinase (bacteriophytochrome)/ActR/RegA family two-component response regulator